ncbi:hypothetical protein WN943_009440 [Citrus x changshan-huyou]
MDLRLLYCVHMGGSWFGKWGYEFFCGSYGVLKGIFEDTIETLSSLKLVNATQDLSENVASHIKKTNVATSAISVVNDDNDEATDPSTSTRITNLPHINGQKIVSCA